MPSIYPYIHHATILGVWRFGTFGHFYSFGHIDSLSHFCSFGHFESFVRFPFWQILPFWQFFCFYSFTFRCFGSLMRFDSNDRLKSLTVFYHFDSFQLLSQLQGLCTFWQFSPIFITLDVVAVFVHNWPFLTVLPYTCSFFVKQHKALFCFFLCVLETDNTDFKLPPFCFRMAQVVVGMLLWKSYG